MSAVPELCRRRFLEQSAAALASGGLLASSAAPEQGPLLRAISSYMSCPDVGYFFAFDSVKFYRNIDRDMKAVRDAGFNVLYLLYMPYRSEDGQPTPWQEDIPLNDPDFASVPPPGPEAAGDEAETFRRILAACRKHGLKTMFNVGCWTPQKWLRENSDAISKFPGDSPQYDRIFEKNFGGKHILTPCFRSPKFLGHTEAVVRAWLRQYRGSSAFEAVLPRVRATDRFEIRLDDQGVPLFYIHQDTIDRNWCHCSTCQVAFRTHLRQRYGSIGRVNSALRTGFASFDEAAIPLSPFVPERHRFKAIDPVADPGKKQLWYEAACFWSSGIAGW
ncbi:MAG: beta-galactosidase, partial [Acidobacteria bacterium]|nr:beta-galactosidase [Acidobacteriota bacterium]